MYYKPYLSNKLVDYFAFVFRIQLLINSTMHQYKLRGNPEEMLISIHSKDFEGVQFFGWNFGLLKSVQVLSWTPMAKISSHKLNPGVVLTVSDYKILPQCKIIWNGAVSILHSGIFFFFNWFTYVAEPI